MATWMRVTIPLLTALLAAILGALLQAQCYFLIGQPNVSAWGAWPILYHKFFVPFFDPIWLALCVLPLCVVVGVWARRPAAKKSRKALVILVGATFCFTQFCYLVFLRPPAQKKSALSASTPHGVAQKVKIVLYAEPALRPFLEPAINSFNQQSSEFYVCCVYLPSREALKTIEDARDYANGLQFPIDDGIDSGDEILDPTKARALKDYPNLWIPIHTHWLYHLIDVWIDAERRRKYGVETTGYVVHGDEKQIVSTCLVMVVREQRASAIEAAMNGKYRGKTWLMLRDLAELGWAAIGHPEWPGWPELVHSDPILSNSGLLTIAMAYACYAEWRSRRGEPFSVFDAEFVDHWLAPVERRVHHYPRTTALVMDTFLNPHCDGNVGIPDIAFTYETCSLLHAPAGYRVMYPDCTVNLALTGSILHVKDRTGTDHTSPKQEEGARQFLASLESDNVQKEAAHIGLHSTNLAVGDWSTQLPAATLRSWESAGYRPTDIHFAPFPNTEQTNETLTYLEDLARKYHYCSPTGQTAALD